MNNRLNLADELQCIYSTLRRLRSIKSVKLPSRDNKEPIDDDVNNSTLRGSLVFPRRFLLKLLEDRLEDLNKRAVSICDDLFKQIGGKVKRLDEQMIQLVAREEMEQKANLNDRKQDPLEQLKLTDLQSRCPELNEYFHHSLYYLHDFLIDFDWHEPNLNVIDKADLEYASEKLPLMKTFILFQKKLDDQTIREANKVSKISPKELIGGSNYSMQRVTPNERPYQVKVQSTTIKSSPSSPLRKTLSPSGQKKRVRFVESPLNSESDTGADKSKLKQVTNVNSEIDLRLQERLSDRLVEWSEQYQSDFDDPLRLLLESKQKIGTPQLRAIARRLKIYNDVHLTVLDYITEIKQVYLIKQVACILISHDKERVQSVYKQPRLNVYIKRISQDVESKLILRLTKQCLGISVDLMTGELNMDLLASKKGEDGNILNFISNWLKLDDIVFGFATNTNKSTGTNTSRKNAVPSSSSLDAQFKSSSRIVVQMDNLSELMRALTSSISTRLRNQQQIRLFLETLLHGLDQAFDIMSQQLRSIVDYNNLIAAKIKSLKFIYIIGSLEKVLIEEALRNKIVLDDRKLETKLTDFSDFCKRIPSVD